MVSTTRPRQVHGPLQDVAQWLQDTYVFRISRRMEGWVSTYKCMTSAEKSPFCHTLVIGSSSLFFGVTNVERHLKSGFDDKLGSGWEWQTWWRHQMEIFSMLLASCEGDSPVTGEFPSQRPVTRNIDVLFDLQRNKRWNKRSRCWWFETPSCSSWRHCNDLPNEDWRRHYVTHNLMIHNILYIFIFVRGENIQA